MTAAALQKPLKRRLAAAVGVLALAALAACAPAGGRQAPAAPAAAGEGTPPEASPPPASRRELPGAGAVAFDASAARLAWAAGNEVRILDLRSGRQEQLATGATVTDLGFTPDGALWVVGDHAALWRAGRRFCIADAEAERLLALDDEGAVVAAYAYSDGTGMLRRQVWLDPQCAIVRESTRRLPPQVQDAEADPGEAPGRASLRPPRAVPSAAVLPAGAAGARPVAVSGDGRWWVLEEGGKRTLWEAGRP